MKKSLRGLVCAASILVATASWAATPETHLHIHVTNDLGKPVGNASVIVRFVEGRFLNPKKKKIEWEMRTTTEGTVSPPGIPQGKILIQISGQNYQTFGQVFDIEEAEKTVEIQLKPPQPQYSSDAPPAKK